MNSRICCDQGQCSRIVTTFEWRFCFIPYCEFDVLFLRHIPSQYSNSWRWLSYYYQYWCTVMEERTVITHLDEQNVPSCSDNNFNSPSHPPPSQPRSTSLNAWNKARVHEYSNSFLRNSIIHPCHYFNNGVAKPPLVLEHRDVLTHPCPNRAVNHDDVISGLFPRYWPFVRGIHRWPVIPLTKASDAELWCDAFFDLRLNHQLSEQWRRWWFETPLRSLWCHYNKFSYKLQ